MLGKYQVGHGKVYREAVVMEQLAAGSVVDLESRINLLEANIDGEAKSGSEIS